MLKREDAEAVTKERKKKIVSTPKKHPLNSPEQRNQIPRLTNRTGAQAPSTHHLGKRRIFPQVLHQILHVAQIPPQHSLLLLRAPRPLTLLHPAATALRSTRRAPPLERAERFARAAALQRRSRVGRAGRGGGRGRLGHQVEVEELEQLELDALRGVWALEQARDGQQAVDALEGAGVVRVREERGYEDEERAGLDGRAVEGVEEVEEQVHVDFAGENGAGGGVEQEDSLEV